MFYKDCKIRIIFNCYVTDDVDVVPLVVRVFFGQLLENLRIVVGNLRKLVKNNKLLVDIEFLFSCLILYLAGDLCSLVRYRVEHSKRYCISVRVYIYYICEHFFATFSFAIRQILPNVSYSQQFLLP